MYISKDGKVRTYIRFRNELIPIECADEDHARLIDYEERCLDAQRQEQFDLGTNLRLYGLNAA